MECIEQLFVEGDYYQMVDGRPSVKKECASETLKYKIGADTFYGLFGNKSILMEKYDYADATMKFREELAKGVSTMNNLKLYVAVE